VEFSEFMKAFGGAIAGEALPVTMKSDQRQFEAFKKSWDLSSARHAKHKLSAEATKELLAKKLATMSSSVRKIFQMANSERTDPSEGSALNKREFKTLINKCNIQMEVGVGALYWGGEEKRMVSLALSVSVAL
jgi:hypothetical protein